jgi:phosphoenolpyruvate synthase/pyruvate phosphate dikinase
LTLEKFAEAFDGFLFDVGELAQLAQGMDGRNVRVRDYYNEKHPAVLSLLETGLKAAKKLKKKAGLVNIAPGNLKAFAEDPAFKSAGYVVVRPDVFSKAREEFLEVQKG